MLLAIAIILALLWALGLATSVTLGGYVHVLAGLAMVLLLLRSIRRSERRNHRHTNG